MISLETQNTIRSNLGIEKVNVDIDINDNAVEEEVKAAEDVNAVNEDAAEAEDQGEVVESLDNDVEALEAYATILANGVKDGGLNHTSLEAIRIGVGNIYSRYNLPKSSVPVPSMESASDNVSRTAISLEEVTEAKKGFFSAAKDAIVKFFQAIARFFSTIFNATARLERGVENTIKFLEEKVKDKSSSFKVPFKKAFAGAVPNDVKPEDFSRFFGDKISRTAGVKIPEVVITALSKELTKEAAEKLLASLEDNNFHRAIAGNTLVTYGDFKLVDGVLTVVKSDDKFEGDVNVKNAVQIIEALQKLKPVITEFNKFKSVKENSVGKKSPEDAADTVKKIIAEVKNIRAFVQMVFMASASYLRFAQASAKVAVKLGAKEGDTSSNTSSDVKLIGNDG